MLIKRCVLSALNRALSSFTKAFCLCLIFAFIFVLNTTNAQEQNNSDTNASSQSETTQATSTEQNHMSYYFANDIAATMHDDQYSLIDVTIPPLKVMMEADAHEQNKQLQDAEQETPASDTTLEPADATEPAQPIEPIQPCIV